MYNQEKPTFNINEPFLGVTTVQLNRPMVDLLINVLQDQEGQLEKEIWAFIRALNDPAGCREMRTQRKKIMRPPIRTRYSSPNVYNQYGQYETEYEDEQPTPGESESE